MENSELFTAGVGGTMAAAAIVVIHVCCNWVTVPVAVCIQHTWTVKSGVSRLTLR